MSQVNTQVQFALFTVSCIYTHTVSLLPQQKNSVLRMVSPMYKWIYHL